MNKISFLPENIEKGKAMIEAMLQECINDLLSIGIPIQTNKIRGISFKKIRRTQACCLHIRKDNEIWFEIALHDNFLNYLNDKAVIANVKNSIYHELIHTCPDCLSHNNTYIRYAKLCNEEFYTNLLVYRDKRIYYNKFQGEPLIYYCPKCGFEHIRINKVKTKLICDTCGSVFQLKLK